MMNAVKVLALAGFAGVVLAAAAPANALTSSQTVTFGPAVTDYNGTGLGSQSFNLFDSTIGTLNSITFTSSYGFTSTITVMNTAQNSSSGSASTKSGSQFSSNIAAITSALNSYVNLAGTFNAGGTSLTPTAFKITGDDASYNLAAGQSAQLLSTGTTQTHGPIVDTNSANLTAFSAAGGGIANILFNTLTGTNLDNTGGNTSASQNTIATGSLQLTYDYTAAPPVGVPEPASLALLGAGLVGLGMIRRKAA